MERRLSSKSVGYYVCRCYGRTFLVPSLMSAPLITKPSLYYKETKTSSKPYMKVKGFGQQTKEWANTGCCEHTSITPIPLPMSRPQTYVHLGDRTGETGTLRVISTRTTPLDGHLSLGLGKEVGVSLSPLPPREGTSQTRSLVGWGKDFSRRPY